MALEMDERESFLEDSKKLNNKILELIKYINDLDIHCKGKKERIYIGDHIDEIKEGLKKEFQNIEQSKNAKRNKESMQASVQEMSGTFSLLIKTMHDKSYEVSDLTLNQYLIHQSKELTKWKNKNFKIRDSVSKDTIKIDRIIDIVKDANNSVISDIVKQIDQNYPDVEVVISKRNNEFTLKFENIPQDINKWIIFLLKLEKKYQKFNAEVSPEKMTLDI